MKKLLWLISIFCFLPAVTGMASQAASLDSGVADLETSKVASEFLAGRTRLGKPAAAVKNLASRPAADVSSPAGAAQSPTVLKAVDKEIVGIDNAVQPSPLGSSRLLAQTGCNCDFDDSISDLDNQLGAVKFPSSNTYWSPALSINNPVGFGADGGIAFLAGSYQSRTRGSQKSDGELGIGIGLGDAYNSIGAELSYTINSFGTSQGFGSGGFNAKLHKRIADDTAVAIGWNRFANIQSGNNPTDYPKNSYYAVATQVVRTSESLDDFFSRIALSAGVGGGQFLSFDSTPAGLERGGVNAFGSAAFRLARPVSAIVEWTGQDLAAGLSIVPFPDFPLVITPAFRDISGINGESARFVLGVSTAIKF